MAVSGLKNVSLHWQSLDQLLHEQHPPMNAAVSLLLVAIASDQHAEARLGADGLSWGFTVLKAGAAGQRNSVVDLPLKQVP